MSDRKTWKKTQMLFGASAIALAASIGFMATAEAFGGKSRHGERGFMGGFGPGLMQGFDQNSDGAISEQEVEAHLLALFDKADADKNGAVSLEEFTSARKTMMENRGQKGGQSGARRGERRMERLFERVDENEDGEVTKEEFRASFSEHIEDMAERATHMQTRLGEHFDQLDANGDGQISKEEFLSAPFASSRGEHGGWGRDKR